jgi:DNA modification methylase
MLLKADARRIPLRDRSVQCIVTSPPYWGLRDYGIEPTVWDAVPGCMHVWGDLIQVNATNHTDKRRWNHTRNGRDEEQPIEKRVAWLRTLVDQGNFCRLCGAWRGALGLEPTPDLFVKHIVTVGRELGRVLRDDGTLWLNLGDTYVHGIGAGACVFANGRTDGRKFYLGDQARGREKRATLVAGLKPKDLVGIPWRVAFALQADGWYLRSDIIWSKPNPMPESVTDRPTKAHEYIFLLTKSERYYFDQDAIREPHAEVRDWPTWEDRKAGGAAMRRGDPGVSGDVCHWAGVGGHANGRNKRTVWHIATEPYPDAHFATFPEALIEPCILAGARVGDLVLDPFIGSGTTGAVCDRLMRRWIGLDLTYQHLARRRTAQRGLPMTTAAAPSEPTPRSIWEELG